MSENPRLPWEPKTRVFFSVVFYLGFFHIKPVFECVATLCSSSISTSTSTWYESLETRLNIIIFLPMSYAAKSLPIWALVGVIGFFCRHLCLPDPRLETPLTWGVVASHHHRSSPAAPKPMLLLCDTNIPTLRCLSHRLAISVLSTGDVCAAALQNLHHCPAMLGPSPCISFSPSYGKTFHFLSLPTPLSLLPLGLPSTNLWRHLVRVANCWCPLSVLPVVFVVCFSVMARCGSAPFRPASTWVIPFGFEFQSFVLVSCVPLFSALFEFLLLLHLFVLYSP